MAAPHERLNRGAQAGADAAAHLLPSLTRAYERSLRAAGRRAAARFRRTETVTAAAVPQTPPGWVIPPTGQLIDQGELAADTQRKTGRLHGRMLTAAAVPALDPFGIRFDLEAPTSQAILDAYAKRITDTVGSAIGEQVTEVIRDGYAKGASVDQVSRAIVSKTSEISKVRADMLARSDLNGIANAGSLLAASVTGAAGTKTWTTAGDERVRPDHEDADGQTVAINDSFDVGGESAQFPGDSSLSWEQSANCRCTLTYGNPLTASARPREVMPLPISQPMSSAAESTVTSGDRAQGREAQPLAAAATPGVLYLARHGLTAYDSDDHARDTIRGWADDPLTGQGVAEARRLAANLDGLGIDTMATSDLQRAESTADEIVDVLQVGCAVTDELRPWNLGDLQGRTSDDARDDLIRFCDHPDETVPGGESFNAFCSRFLPAVADAMAAAENGVTPLLVTHSHNLKLARAWIAGGRAPVTGEAFMAPSPGPASVLRFDPARGWACTEILCDGRPPDELGSVPPRVHYRPASDADRECGTCEFYSAGRCSMFDAAVLADYVCDEFVARSTLTSGGNMSGIVTDALEGMLREDAQRALAQGRGLPLEIFVGGTSLPLGDRDRAWDAPAATKRVAKWASSDGSGDKDKVNWGKYGRAFFAGSGEDFSDYHLPFCDVVGGKLTAVWRGIVAAGQRLNQTQGVDKAAIAKAIDGWYRRAAKQYGDDSIVAPGDKKGASADGETLATIHSFLADQGADGVLDDEEIRAYLLVADYLGTLASTKKHAYAGNGGACKICGEPPGDASAHYAVDALTAATQDGTPWQATLCVAGEPTVDSGIKRVLDPGGGSWLPLPLPLALLDDSPHADVTTKSPVVGRIDQIWMAGDVVQASGIFFDRSDDPKLAEQAGKASALVDGMLRMGISVDLVDTEVEMCAWGDGGEIPMDAANDPTSTQDMVGDPNAPGGPATETGLPTDIPDEQEIDEPKDEPDLVYLFRQWVIGGATICPVQALTQATISLVASGFQSPTRYRWFAWTRLEPGALTASAAGLAPAKPPREWFDVAEAEEPTPLTVTDDGQVYGHMALWNSCHTGFADRCVPPPKSPSDYSGFHLGEMVCADGSRVEVGTLTMDTGHAGLRLSAGAAVDHYDNTGTAASYVRASDGRHGIWVCGALSARLDAASAQALMAAKPSGDWREIFRGKGRDMIGALMVNVPGFVVPRTLTAAGLPFGDATVEFSCAPCDAELDRLLAVEAASVDGVEGLAALVEA